MKQISKINDDDCGLDPFVENITLSSFVNKLYRRNFMPENSIPWIPSNGYNPMENTSLKAEMWLKYLSEKNNTYIKHAKNGGEKDAFQKRQNKYLNFRVVFIMDMNFVMDIIRLILYFR